MGFQNFHFWLQMGDKRQIDIVLKMLSQAFSNLKKTLGFDQVQIWGKFQDSVCSSNFLPNSVESVGLLWFWTPCCKALGWGIMRQAPIYHLRLCPHFLQCVPWTWASPDCRSLSMTKQSPDLFLSQLFIVQPLSLPPISNHLLCVSAFVSFRWVYLFHFCLQLNFIPLLKLHLGYGGFSYV